MAATIEATFDGTVFRPREPVPLARIPRSLTVEALPSGAEKTASFLQTARALNLEGPRDWSANLHRYLYGQETERAT